MSSFLTICEHTVNYEHKSKLLSEYKSDNDMTII